MPCEGSRSVAQSSRSSFSWEAQSRSGARSPGELATPVRSREYMECRAAGLREKLDEEGAAGSDVLRCVTRFTVVWFSTVT